MSSKRWNYVDVNCVSCDTEGKIRIDQYNRKGKKWECRSCAFTGRKLEIKNPSAKHDSIKAGAYKSYWRAKRRCQTGHSGYYTNVEFKFSSFEQFFDEIGPRPEGKTLDRIDNLGHYEPGNVRWATPQEQMRNVSSNVILEYNGKMLCLTDAAKAAGIDPATIYRRIKNNCPPSHLFIKGKWRYKNGALAPLN